MMALQDDTSNADGDGGQAAATQDSQATDDDGTNAGTAASEDDSGSTGVDLGANDDTAAQDDAADTSEVQQPQVTGQRIGWQNSPPCVTSALCVVRHPLLCDPGSRCIHPLEDHVLRAQRES
jgi:hypothetical protein